MTDAELRDFIVAELKQTGTTGYDDWVARRDAVPSKYPDITKTHWWKALDGLAKIGAAAPPPPPPPPPPGRLATMETGDFSQFDSINSGTQGIMTVDSTRAYEGTRSAHATTPTGSGTKYARGIFNVNWVSGSDVSYSAAFWLPTDFYSKAQGWVDILRWDNWTLAQRSQDQAGVTVTPDGKLLFTKRDLNLPNNGLVYLTPPVAAPFLGAWHHIKVHQRFSAVDGSALNELWVDAVKVASSTAANYNGRPVTALRVGIVAVNDATQRNQVDLWFDNAGVSSA
jgi:hypothetical protein